MEYMTCNSCKRIVEVNNTGICVGCQMGFNPSFVEDYLNKNSAIEENLNKEKDDATSKRKKQESNIPKHQNRNGSRKTSKTSNSNSIKHSGQKSQEKEKINNE